MRIRVLVADDHPLVRKGTIDILEEFEDIEVVGAACNGQEAVEQCALLTPDVVLMDLSMPILDGAGATRQIKKKQKGVGIVVLSALDDDGAILRALQAGADGYLIKTATEEQLVQAIRLVAQGKPALLQPEIARSVLAQARSPVEALSPREVEVLKEAAHDLGNKEIATRLSISERTVQQHLSNIFSKLDVSSRTGAVLKALQLGTLTLEETLK
ncbi:MAG TPA: DNA-binding response regulator [Cyanobacteria bacterium UBA8530]|nr:DNA-binding response regulator [Cyanobacteria bacterium UBA8530]